MALSSAETRCGHWPATMCRACSCPSRLRIIASAYLNTPMSKSGAVWARRRRWQWLRNSVRGSQVTSGSGKLYESGEAVVTAPNHRELTGGSSADKVVPTPPSRQSQSLHKRSWRWDCANRRAAGSSIAVPCVPAAYEARRSSILTSQHAGNSSGPWDKHLGVEAASECVRGTGLALAAGWPGYTTDSGPRQIPSGLMLAANGRWRGDDARRDSDL